MLSQTWEVEAVEEPLEATQVALERLALRPPAGGINSGSPYNAIGPVNSARYVTNPGYRQVPGSVNYYFSERDGFRTDAWYSTDISATYTYKLPAGGRQAALFVKADVLNLFNQAGLVVPRFINTGVLTNVNRPATLQAFSPFTEAPVQSVHLALDPACGTATSRFGYQLPRTFRMSLGVRFLVDRPCWRPARGTAIPCATSLKHRAAIRPALQATRLARLLPLHGLQL